jgi:hypothetical protein
MKAILEYNLNERDDIKAHLRAVKSLDMAVALWEIMHNTKKGLEWTLEGKELDKYDTLELVFDKINEIFREHNIILDELID